MTLVLRNCDFEPEGLNFSDPTPNKHGGKTIYINYDHQGRVHKQCLLQTPWLTNPFGLNKAPEQPGEDPKYSIELSFGNAPSAYVESFHQKMKDTDTLIRTKATENSVDWLERDEVDDELLDEFHKPIVRPYKNKDKEATGEYPDTMRFKVPYYINTNEETGEQTESFGGLEVYNANLQRIEVKSVDDLRTALGKGTRMRAIAQPATVWRTGNEFGVSWRLLRLQVIQRDNGLGEECAFDQSDEINAPGNSDEEEEY